MNSINKIKERFKNIIDKEINRTKKELNIYVQKMIDNDSYYGLGGMHSRYEKAIERREKHLEELTQLNEQSCGKTVMLEKLTVYPFFCPNCQLQVMLNLNTYRNKREETIDCPICYRPIYKTCRCKSWNIEKGSEYVEKNR